MKKLSAQTFLQQSLQVVQRFPLTLLFAAALTVLTMRLFSNDWQTTDSVAGRLQKVFYLGMVMSISAALIAERLHAGFLMKCLVATVCLVVCLLYYLDLCYSNITTAWLRFALLTITLHLLVAISPFLRAGSLQGLWQFNKTIFLRILLAALYSAVLYAGLALALAGTNKLLGIEFTHNTYLYLWALIAILFNTWFFLAGIPADFAALDENREYPRGLKVFTANVLLPLVLIYMTILYLYVFKIIFTQSWPHNIIPYMVAAFAFFGILSLLLLYPLLENGQYRWITISSRVFYYLLLPLVGMMATGIVRRIAQYGVTEERYLAFILALWLGLIVVVASLRPLRVIRFVPLSLLLVSLFSCFGPWGAFSVSRNSQLKRLSGLFQTNGILQHEKVPASFQPHWNVLDEAEAESIVRYMVNVHGVESLQPLFVLDLNSFAGSYDADYYAAAKINEFLTRGTDKETESTPEHSKPAATAPAEVSLFANTDQTQMLDITGYHFAHSFEFAYSGHFTFDFRCGKKIAHLSFDHLTDSFTLQMDGETPLNISLRPHLQKIFESMDVINADKVPPAALSFTTSKGPTRVKIALTNLQLLKTSSYRAGRMNGWLLLSY